MYDIKELGMIPPPYGGVSVYLRRLIENLNADGFTVGGYYMSTKDKAVSDSPLFDPWSWFETAKFPVKIFGYLRQLRKYRILHSHMGLEAMAYLWTLKKVLRKKVVITVHNSMVENYFNETNWINAHFLRLMAKEKDVVWIAVSQEGKRQLEALHLDFGSEIHVLHAYIPEFRPDVVLSQEMIDYMNRHDKNLAFYGHSFMLNKGEDVYGFKSMLEIFKRISEKSPQLGMVYCMADVSDAVAISELEQCAKDLGVYEKIFWQRGSLTSLQALWEAVDVYVRPTSTDGDSVAVREAIAAGVQVVATDVVKRPEQCIIYHQGDLEEASKKIQNALNEGRHPIMKDFSQYEKMKAIYRNLLNN